jgi:3-phosphoshikimate 1-carboxyvinyltransferase
MKSFSVLAGVSSQPYVATIPGSKSYTNRALVLAAQRLGTTVVKNALICDDTLYLAQALDKFDGLTVRREGRDFVVTRSAQNLGAPNEPLFVGGAGTPARLLLSFAVTANGETTITGNTRLCERPMGDLLNTFDQIGIKYRCLSRPGCLPVTISGGRPTSSRWSINGGVSSQFVTSLLLFAAQQQDLAQVDVTVTGEMVSRSYIGMTVAMMRDCGIEVAHDGDRHFEITPARPKSAQITIEVDASGMSYPLTAAAITGSTVTIPGIGRHSVQGDVGLVEAYRRMGCRTTLEEDRIILTGGSLQGIDIDMDTMPDVVLSLAIAATQARSPTRIRNIGNLRVKECDRIAAIANELGRLGIKVEDGPDWLVIHPGQPKRRAEIHTYDDHRVAMAFSLLGLLYDGLTLDDYECVSKSFPDYWNEMTRFIAHHRTVVEQPLAVHIN